METVETRRMKFGIFMTLQPPSIICYLASIHYILTHRGTRQALHHHGPLVLLFVGLFTVIFDLSMILDFLRTGFVTPRNEGYCIKLKCDTPTARSSHILSTREGPAERRKRLQNLISSLYDDEIAKVLRKNEEDDERVEDTKEYHEGLDELQTARCWIAEYSLSMQRAKEHIEKLKEYVAIPEAITLHCSQLDDNRPLPYCEFSPNGQMAAVSSWHLDFIFQIYIILFEKNYQM
ncbi:unnamed protein product [Rotaria socialis]|uniref:Uncharacterized protein n=2 Tax=Rotaria TaxID=231623 RepID=A0A821T008_9BILA|nr:unnamed protein product [Rotaria socialis]CAF4612315.1 unnamed protein product [Rotaria socialis]CAF4864692.1 unnamed protein product [Rotaria socialis]